MRRVGFAILGAVVVFAAAVPAIAETGSLLGGKLRAGDTVVVPAGETVEGDLYAFAGDVRIDGTVTGDVVVFAGQVAIGGEVGGDVLASGGTVDITGPVDGDVRVGAGQVTVSGPVGEDLLAAAGRVTVRGDVGDDLIFGAGQVIVGGDVGGNVVGNAGAYTNRGRVAGTEEVRVDRPQRRERRPLARAVGRFASTFLVGLGLLAYRRRRWVDETTHRLSADLGPSVGWGLVFVVGLIVVPVGSLIVGILVAVLFGWLGLGPLVGLTLLAMMATWATVALLAFLVVALLAPITVGTWLAGLALPDSTPIYLAMAVGVAVLVVVGLIPVFGPLVGLAVTILGGGAWVRAAWPRRRVVAGESPPAVDTA